MRPADLVPWNDEQRAAAVAQGLDPDVEQANAEPWRNGTYTALVARYQGLTVPCTCPAAVGHQLACPLRWGGRPVKHISIRRNDRKPMHDWRHLQRIKNEIAGPECEAVELYPAVERLVDDANQYHLWVLPPGERFPLGFANGSVSEGGSEALGAVQRPLDPADTPQPVDNPGEALDPAIMDLLIADLTIDADALVAAVTVCAQAGGTDFQLERQGDQEPAMWQARVGYDGRVWRAAPMPGAVEAAEALARDLLVSGLCNRCGRRVRLGGIGAGDGSCRWTRHGDRWVRGADCTGGPARLIG